MATVDVTRIASNIGALNSLNSLMNINAKLATHQTRLSTGKRINSAADDPAGLTIATKMLARSEGLKVYARQHRRCQEHALRRRRRLEQDDRHHHPDAQQGGTGCF
jgi:hypothetical protein